MLENYISGCSNVFNVVKTSFSSLRAGFGAAEGFFVRALPHF